MCRLILEGYTNTFCIAAIAMHARITRKHIAAAKVIRARQQCVYEGP